MKVTRGRAFAVLTVALLWAMSPAVACVLPGSALTPAEQECCHHAVSQCGNLMMPASHVCCQAPARTNAVLNQAQATTPVRHVAVATLPSVISPAALVGEMPSWQFLFLHAPPPEPFPGGTSILRI